MNTEIPIILADSITHVPDKAETPRVIICGSHGGWVAGVFALKKHLQGVIFNDAGIGKEQAGIAGLLLLEKYEIYGAAVDTFTAKIGIAKETESGIISFVNAPARRLGIQIGMTGHEVSLMMKNASHLLFHDPLDLRGIDGEEKVTVIHSSSEGYRIVAMDSNSMITPENRKDIILTGSHGGRVGSAPVVKYPVIAAFYNDAGVGKEQAGINRLPWLQDAGIIAATVNADSAKIGIGMETYENGIISHVNLLASQSGIYSGMRASDAAWRILREKENNAPVKSGRKL